MPVFTSDITVRNLGAGETQDYPHMIAARSVLADITPSSLRRTDGDTRFLEIPTEGFWSQIDFAGGIGVLTKPDGASYYSGPVDTTLGDRIQCPWGSAGWNQGSVVIKIWFMAGTFGGVANAFWAIVDNGTALQLAYRRVADASWTLTALSGFSSTLIKDVVVFRGLPYLCYGSSGAVQRIETGLTLTNITGFYGERLAPYLSMLFSAYSGTLTRYDPENPTPILTVARFGEVHPDGVGALVAAYGQLFCLMGRSLYTFSSQNGNSGTLVGPVDSFIYAPGAPRSLYPFGGSLVYGAGTSIRRYFPGGEAAPFYPAQGRRVEAATGWGYVDDLLVVADRLYLAVRPSNGVAAARLLEWTGTGMHVVGGDYAFGGNSPSAPIRLASDESGTILLYSQTQVAIWKIVTPASTGDAGQERAGVAGSFATGTWVSSWLTFGIDDVKKALPSIGIAGLLPSGTTGSIGLEYRTEGGAWTALALGAFPRRTAAADLDTQPGVAQAVIAATAPLVGKRFQLRLTLTPSTGGGETPVVIGVFVTPNPVMPLRVGGRLAVEVSRAVLDSTGAPLYATDADVVAAFNRLMAWRQDGDSTSANLGKPLQVRWLDGQTYYMRANTRTVTRLVAPRNEEPAWLFEFDLQQVAV